MSSRIPGYKAGLCSFPNKGDQQLEYTLNTGASGVVHDDLFEELALNEIDFVQSIFVDNSNNASAFQITFPGIDRGYTIVVQPFHQGWYPVSTPIGRLRFSTIDVANTSRTLIFSNIMMPYFDWGPISGVLVVPALVPAIIDAAQVGDGTVVIVPAVAAQSAKMYRLQFTVDNSCTIQFKDTAGALLTGKITLFAGGSITWQASGVPWITSAVGQGIEIVLTNTAGATVQIGGLMGYQQN